MAMPAAGDDSVSLFILAPYLLPSHDYLPQDSDYPTRTPRKAFGIHPYGGGAMASGGMLGGEPRMGKIGDSSLFLQI